MLGQLLIQFQDQPIVTSASHSLLNDTNQLQLNRSARYAEQNVDQFRSIEQISPSEDDFFPFDDLAYSNSGNELNRMVQLSMRWTFFFELLFPFAAPPKIKREIKSDSQNRINDGQLNKSSLEPKPISSEIHNGLHDESFATKMQRSLEYVWSDMYWLATAVVIMTLLGCFFAHHADLRQRMVGARMRVACCSLIYRKVYDKNVHRLFCLERVLKWKLFQTLRLSKKSSSQTGTGYIVNLLSNDVSRLDYGFIYVHYVWILPLQSALIAYLIWNHIGWASLVGVIGLLIKTIPVQTGLSRLSSVVRMKVARRTDQRVGIMHEIIQGIQVSNDFSMLPYN